MNTYLIMLSIIGLFMLVFYTYYYFKYKYCGVSFPLFIYLAMFPFDLSNIIPYYDIAIKSFLIMGILYLVFTKHTIKFNIFEIVFLLYVWIFSTLINIVDGNKILNASILNLSFMMVFSFYSYNSIKSNDQMKILFKLFSINAIVLAFISFIEYYIFRVNRPSLSFGNPNYFALYQIISLLCFTYIYKKIDYKLILFYLIVIYSIILSSSNTVFLILCILVFYRILMFIKNNRISITILSICLVCAAIFYMYAAIFLSESNIGILKIFLKEDLSRLYIWNKAWHLFTQDIFGGVGFGNLLIKYELNNVNYVTHNDYLRILCEVGLIGFIIIFAYIISLYKTIIKNRKYILLFFLIVLLAFAITHNNLNSILFWWFLSLPLYRDCFKISDKKERCYCDTDKKN